MLPDRRDQIGKAPVGAVRRDRDERRSIFVGVRPEDFPDRKPIAQVEDHVAARATRHPFGARDILPAQQPAKAGRIANPFGIDAQQFGRSRRAQNPGHCGDTEENNPGPSDPVHFGRLPVRLRHPRPRESEKDRSCQVVQGAAARCVRDQRVHGASPTSSLSILRSSMSTISNRQPCSTKLSPSTGKCFSAASASPATVA